MSPTLLFVLSAFSLGSLLSWAPDATAQSQQFGLEWPGDGAQRRMLYWHNPFPIYDATYIFKVYPRKKTTGQYRYYTTFFWGNDGEFSWDTGVYPANTYYGAHPYPTPAPLGPGQWEISMSGNDFTTGSEVQWNRWYTQAFRAWRESPTLVHHEFYWDLPDTSKVIKRTITDHYWANKNPPIPSIHMGQAAWQYYVGDEEFNGIIRGIQMYSGLLSLADIQSEIAAPKSTAAGQNFIWYLNVDPRPSDVTDKKGIGTPHNPSWRGTTAMEWSNQASPPPPTPPAISAVAATNVTTSGATIAWTTNEPADSQVDYGTTTAYGQTTTVNPSLVTSHSMNLSALVAGTTYHYRVRSRDAESLAATSADFTFTTTAAGDTIPPAISAVSATSITASGATIRWTTNEPSDSQVDYGTTTAYGQTTTVNPSLVTSHSMNLPALVAGTTYHYRVRCRDAAGNVATSADFTFTTVATGDTTPPAISAVGSTNITASGATITWTTNESSDSQVDYGTTTAYGQTTTLNPSLVTSHSMSLSALSADTTYHFRVRSRDAAGNPANSTDFTFRTAPQGGGTVTALAAYSFNEAAGSATADASSHGFNGTLVSGPVWTSGHSSNALSFDGVNDKVSLPSTLDISRLPFTLEAWIRPSSRSDWRAIFSKRGSYSASDMRFDVGLAITSGRVFVTSAQTTVTFNYAPPLNAWTHFAVVAESSGTRLYVNGVLTQTVAAIALGTRATAPVAIGNTGDSDDPFAGVIDDLRLYDRALAASEIQSDMNSGLF